MTISPFPGQIKRREVLDAAKRYVPPPKHRPGASALVWIGAVLILAGIGFAVSLVTSLW